ncbi:MAG: hypothetical protein ACRDMV_16935 [Streptosporangiales bacterium]
MTTETTRVLRRERLPVVGQTSHYAVRPHVQSLLTALRPQWPVLAVVAFAVLLWVGSLLGANPRQMDQLGLISLCNVATAVALVVLLVSFLVCLHQNRPGWLLGTHLVTYIALIHGTPAVLYGTLRYAWAYKHVGIVDYILRTGTVDPSISVNAIYHNWPGFFAGSALLSSAAGQQNSLPITLEMASWAPVAFNLMNLLVLRYLFRGLTRNRQLVWLALLFFFIINWVGQDYFSPQAMAYVLYLAVVGLLVRWVNDRTRNALFVVIVAVVAASHQITPMMLFLAVSALVLLRRTRGRYVPIIAVGIISAWAFTAARDYTVDNIEGLIAGFTHPLSNAETTLDNSTSDSAAQLLVLWGGRFTACAATALAVLGAWRSWRQGTPRLTATILMILPAALVVVAGFGGEAVLRAYLFAAPFIAFLAAEACFPWGRRALPFRNALVAVVAANLFVPGFLLSYYGKEQENYFTPAEVRTASWLDEHATPGSLLVEGNTNYPNQFLDYEKFTYVPIDREPGASVAEVLDHPAGELDEWLSNPRYTNSYVLITRSQKIATTDEHTLPVGGLERVEQALRRSPRFQVLYQTRDATVFTLAPRDGGP